MTLRLLTASSFVAALLVSFSLQAQESGEQFFSFEDDFIDAELVRPDELTVDELRAGRSSSLIRIRMDFVEELVRSVEEL